MGEITVYFIGICTHMQWPEDGTLGEIPGFRHRVVLVNGKEGAIINGRPIPRHLPTLRIAADDLVLGDAHASAASDSILEWELNGVQIEVANAVGELTREPSFEWCIPHLKLLTRDLPHPSAEVVVAAEPLQAAAYFEANHGTFRAGVLPRGASAAVLTITTSTDVVALTFRGFRDGNVQEMLLRSGAAIALSNVGETDMDDDSDFLLHYKTAEYIPANAAVPIQSAPRCPPLDAARVVNPRLNVGPGCSNSNFP